MKSPFEASAQEVAATPEAFVDSVFSNLVSEFLVMPRGEGFIDYETFSAGYEHLKKSTEGFSHLDRAAVLSIVLKHPVVLIVIRSILGFTPPEWAYLATNRKGVDIPQGAARALDRKIRTNPSKPISAGSINRARIEALVETACELIEQGCPAVDADKLHRLNKADSQHALSSTKQLSELGVPYAMLLYERFLGRPFAGHRDSVSELVGDGLETAIEEQLSCAGISFRKTKRAERLAGFDQAPDFIIPDEFHPQVIIEAKLTEDDGTARDKATRIIRLCQMAEAREREGKGRYEVIACLAGRGFGQRREDMRQIIAHTKGKVFTPKTLHRLVDCSALSAFRTKNIPPPLSELI
jgi:hypothetical protein